jgi:hypothetical protein
VLVFGLRPRLSAAATYGLVAWSFLVNLLGAAAAASGAGAFQQRDVECA